MWKLAALVEFCGDGGDFFLGEITGCIAQHFVFFTERVNGKVGHCLFSKFIFMGLYRLAQGWGIYQRGFWR
jgi:hypothetical protein